MLKILKNARVFTSSTIITDNSVVIEDDKIIDVTATLKRNNNSSDQVIDLQGHLLTPGFIDSQVNGGNGILFNDKCNIQAISQIGKAHRQYGTTGFLATLISDSDEIINRSISAAKEAQKAKLPGFLGLHLEGPYLNAVKRGVHSDQQVRAPSSQSLNTLKELASIGQSMVTIAPEVVGNAFIKELSDSGIIVSIGHTNASYQCVADAVASGARGFTHLYNAMSPLNSREPGAVGAALADKNTWCAIIVDGHHVHPIALKIAIAAKAESKIMLVTDAIHCVGAQGNTFTLAGQEIVRSNGKVTTAQGTLAGSDLDMASAVRNCVGMLDIPLEEALRMASLYPAQFLAIDDKYGKIAPGYQASLALLNRQLKVIDTWIDGA